MLRRTLRNRDRNHSEHFNSDFVLRSTYKSHYEVKTMLTKVLNKPLFINFNDSIVCQMLKSSVGIPTGLYTLFTVGISFLSKLEII